MENFLQDELRLTNTFHFGVLAEACHKVLVLKVHSKNETEKSLDNDQIGAYCCTILKL